MTGSVAHADTVTLHPSADTALLENFPENNFGGQAWFNAGTTQNGPRNRGLMQFDIASALPAGATVNSVSLTLEVVGQPVDGDTPSTFGLHQMLVAWGEGTGTGNPPLLGRPALVGEANWTHPFALSPLTWGAPGGLAGVDFAVMRSADTYVYGINFSPYIFASSSGLVADVQSWLDQPASNFGWMILTEDESDLFSARRFASREDPFRAPILEIDFTPVPEPSTAAIIVVGSGVGLLLRSLRLRTSGKARKP